MFRKLLAASLSLSFFFGLSANAGGPPGEGMWLPTALKKIHKDKMKELDIKLNREEIYAINQSSVKDAIIRLNGGMCTAEVVSGKGLLFTNHHCAYDLISSHSTPDNNILENGFFAGSNGEELKNEGYTASRMVRMEKVTSAVAPVLDTMEGRAAQRKRQQLFDSLTTAATQDNKDYIAEVKTMYHGNEYYLTVYEQFKDIRLVGAPPKDIGKFGGDTDNWMWPRHTGDFSVLRIYTNKNNEPSEISDDNVPYDAPYHLPISLNGFEKGDPAIIMGYPGSTDRYLSSYAIQHKMEYEEPTIIDAFGVILDNMEAQMSQNEQAELQLTSRHASLSNFYKYNKGQLRGLRNYDLVGKKAQAEEEFMNWVSEKEKREEKYGDVLSNLEQAYEQLNGISPGFQYFAYGLAQLDLFGFAFRYNRFYQQLKRLKAEGASQGKIDTVAMQFGQRAKTYFGETYEAMEKQAMKDLMVMYAKNVPAGQRPAVLNRLINAHPGKLAENTIREYLNSAFKIKAEDQLNLMGYTIRLNELGRKLTSIDDETVKDSLIDKARKSVMAYHRHKHIEAVGSRSQFKSRLLTIAREMNEAEWPEFLINWKTEAKDNNLRQTVNKKVNKLFADGLFKNPTLLADSANTKKAFEDADASTFLEDPLVKLGGQLRGYGHFTKDAIAVDSAKTMELTANPSAYRLSNEKLLDMAGTLLRFYRGNYLSPYRKAQQQINQQMETYMQGLREWKAGKAKLYPNANSTMRVSYGVVKPYEPADAKQYEYYTTHEGILEKHDPSDEEFQVPDVLMQHIKNENFGRYARSDGDLPLCFLTNNDITGGNSGSPVINGKGNMIGIAFDGNWESMTGDLVINEAVNRTINVDIRYVLFTIDKLYDSQHIMEELEIVQNNS